MQSFIVCCFATIDTPYEEIAESHLLPSLQKLNIEYNYTKIENLGNWNRNTGFKPSFALQMLDIHKDRNIVLLDVDARVEKYPEIFDTIPDKYNIAAHILDQNLWFQRKNTKKELLSGSLFIRNNERSKYLVNEWIEECRRSREWEQRSLSAILALNNERIYELPLSYCYMDTLPDGRQPHIKVDEVIIRHFQASRICKPFVRKIHE